MFKVFDLLLGYFTRNLHKNNVGNYYKNEGPHRFLKFP